MLKKCSIFINSIFLAFFILIKNNRKALRIIQKNVYLSYRNPQKKFFNYDKLILSTVEKIIKSENLNLKPQKETEKTKILILNTEIYDSGGHTELILRFAKAFKDEYEMIFALTDNDSQATAPKKSQIIKENVSQFIEFDSKIDIVSRIINLYNFVIDNKITTIISNIHMYDVVSAAVLGLLKKNTNINILFINHADHFYTVGSEFADTILTRCKNDKPITPHIKDKTNIKNILFIESSNEVAAYTEAEINEEKEKLKIPSDTFITLSGCQFYKINSFTQDYLRLIKNLLKKNQNIYHILICHLSNFQKILIKMAFGKYSRRLILLEPTPKFNLYIQMSDLFIDSFPQGSALTLIDCIKHSKPVIVKINEKNPIKSFEMYLYEDYEYACDTPKEMLEKTCELIENKESYTRICKTVREFYIEKYKIETTKNEYRELIR